MEERTNPERRRAAALLLGEIDLLVGRWSERVRQGIPPARQEGSPIIVDTLPDYIRHLAQSLDPEHPRSMGSEGSSIPTEHGGERARITRFRPDHIILEYQLLRQVLCERLDEVGLAVPPVTDIIVRSIDQAVRESCTAYYLVYSSIREQFTATLTHDLRGPLSNARIGASLILRGSSEDKIRDLAGRVVHNLDRVEAMIRELLDASRVRAGERLPLELASCDLVAIAREAISHLELAHGARFELVGATAVNGVWSRDALGRAIENLCDNAIKYGAGGGKR